MKTKTPYPVSDDYKQMLCLQLIHAEALNELAEIQAQADGALHELLASKKDTFADLTVCVRDCEAALEVIATLVVEGRSSISHGRRCSTGSLPTRWSFAAWPLLPL